MSEEIHELFFGINARHGTTMLAVTHNTELASRMPRRLRMVDGVIVDETGNGPYRDAEATN